MIEVFTKSNCMQCKMTKRWLKEHEIDFIEINIEEEYSAFTFLLENGYRQMPVVMKKGDLVSLGFNPSKLKEAIN